MILIFEASKLCTDICKTIFETLKHQFHHEGGLVQRCYFELFSQHGLYFHPTKDQPRTRLLENPDHRSSLIQTLPRRDFLLRKPNHVPLQVRFCIGPHSTVIIRTNNMCNFMILGFFFSLLFLNKCKSYLSSTFATPALSRTEHVKQTIDNVHRKTFTFIENFQSCSHPVESRPQDVDPGQPTTHRRDDHHLSKKMTNLGLG